MAAKLRTPEEHREACLALVEHGGSPAQKVNITDAVGLTLAAPVVAQVAIPSFNNSQMDGYLVRADDTTTSRFVLGDIAAGGHGIAPETGQAVRIMTGAPVPDDHDNQFTVVPVENTNGGTETVVIDPRQIPHEPGRYIRRAGEDCQPGDIIAHAGHVVTATIIAAALSAGAATLQVRRPPRIAVISTGAELVDITAGHTISRSGQIADSNGPMLAAAARSIGADVTRHSLTTDSPADFVQLLGTLADVDLIVTSGGVSMGAYEVVKEVFTSPPAEGFLAGTSVDFVKVAMQPGQPQGLGTVGSTKIPLIALPGNPVSSLVSFSVFVAPMIRQLLGHPDLIPVVPAKAAITWPSITGKTQWARVRLEREENTLTAVPVSGPGSHLVGSLAHANALAEIPPNVGEVRQGDLLNCIPLTHITNWR